MLTGTPMLLSGNEPTHYQLDETFDPAVGLFIQENHGHTVDTRLADRVHNVVNATTRLLIAAQLGQLATFPTDAVLTAVRRAQHLASDDRRGCLRWYWEDTWPHDTNAAFFIGLDLIVLERRYAAELSAPARETLTATLRDLATWFDPHTSTAAMAFYPNKFLGDLVCAWLLREIHGRTSGGEADGLLDVMRESAAYWRDHRWGWGEHLSDPYAAIMLDQLSALLLLARELPGDVRALYLDLFRDLLWIDDVFSGGPRVPTIRNYLFGAPAPHLAYRDTVRLWTSTGDACHNREEIPHMFKTPYGRVFHELGWQELAGPRAVAPGDRVSVPCIDGTRAEAWIGPRARLGVTTRYPLMPGCDHFGWGLSWQSMPVAFATAGSWNFLRWHTRERGTDYPHPARDKHAATRRNALTDAVQPPIVGLTRAHLHGSRAVVLRVMPALAASWSLVADELVLTGSAELLEQGDVNGFTRLLVRADDEEFTIYARAFGPGACGEPSGKELATGGWRLVHENPAEAGLESLAFLWCVAVGRAEPPRLSLHAGRPERLRQTGQNAGRLAWEDLGLEFDAGPAPEMTLAGPGAP